MYSTITIKDASFRDGMISMQKSIANCESRGWAALGGIFATRYSKDTCFTFRQIFIKN